MSRGVLPAVIFVLSIGALIDLIDFARQTSAEEHATERLAYRGNFGTALRDYRVELPFDPLFSSSIQLLRQTSILLIQLVAILDELSDGLVDPVADRFGVCEE